ncbi:methyltransferase domain-containing protein [Maridesulfovibrio hydrothermalis]|uniref:Uncharacterized protein n=1 Tax=Maridesulfovibrio hydrothermalis AM13 = DSM 14728 TaxID=1121451 RepID=L0RAJ0_9BACT|nr:methyltransferase domain-containing protein [Maridesulfovibrio hydrothermalis]CCO22581.1 protein of unknown function [Maridesulfovibrio hydrothermalis AM13 = DSM 14728]
MNGKKDLKTYHGHIDFTVTNNSHTQAFLFLKEHCDKFKINSPRVLEIGCSGGYFSEALRDNGVYVHAIEPFSTEAQDEGRVDEFFHGTVEEFCKSSSSDLYGSFDAVIMGDILEHLLDPKQTLIDLSPFLKDNGVFIASIPNITHVGVRRMLEDGHWTYQKYGILDSTHVRFFCWKGLRNMFHEAGFGIERRFDVLVPEFKVYPSISSVTEIMFNTELKKGDHTFQYVVCASRSALPKTSYSDSYPTKLLLISPDPRKSVTSLRLVKPLSKYLANVRGGLTAVDFNNFKIEHLDFADVVIFHREISAESYEIVRLARERDIPIIYDTDDLLTHLPPWSLNNISQHKIIMMESLISIADRVTCPTEPLKKEMLKLSDRVHIVPNVILDECKISPHEKQSGDDCSLIIASSDTVIVDFIIKPIQTLCKALPSLKVVTIGNISYKLTGVVPNLTQYGQCNEDEFSNILNSINNGIGLIPLDDSLFSSCKSPIKYYHYACCGIVSVASNVHPYSDYIQNGKNGILVNNTLDEWCNGVVKLIKNHDFRRDILLNAIRSWQKEASTQTAIEGWKRTFAGLHKKE